LVWSCDRNRLAAAGTWEITFRLPHMRCVFRLPQVEHCIVLHLQHCIAFTAFVLHLQHLHCIAFTAWLLVGTVLRFLDQSNQNVFEKTTGLESYCSNRIVLPLLLFLDFPDGRVFLQRVSRLGVSSRVL
jgi:hypothetical protein